MAGPHGTFKLARLHGHAAALVIGLRLHVIALPCTWVHFIQAAAIHFALCVPRYPLAISFNNGTSGNLAAVVS